MTQTDRYITIAAAELLLAQPRRGLKIDPRGLIYDRNIAFDTMENYCRRTNQIRAELVSAASPDGLMIRVGDRYIILYNEKSPPSRRMFTLAHEVGHIYLCHDNDSPEHERQANFFAAQLLMPPVFLKQISREADITPSGVSALFGVSVQVATIQLVYMNAQPEFSEAELRLLEFSRGLLPSPHEPELGF